MIWNWTQSFWRRETISRLEQQSVGWLVKNDECIAWLISKMSTTYMIYEGWRMKITGLQTCSGQIENWNDWFADWVWPILHWFHGWCMKWATKWNIWKKTENCWFAKQIWFWPALHKKAVVCRIVPTSCALLALELFALLCCGMFAPALCTTLCLVWGFWSSGAEQSEKA